MPRLGRFMGFFIVSQHIQEEKWSYEFYYLSIIGSWNLVQMLIFTSVRYSYSLVLHFLLLLIQFSCFSFYFFFLSFFNFSSFVLYFPFFLFSSFFFISCFSYLLCFFFHFLSSLVFFFDVVISDSFYLFFFIFFTLFDMFISHS